MKYKVGNFQYAKEMFYLFMLFSLPYNVYLLAQTEPFWDLPNYNKCVMFITYFNHYRLSNLYSLPNI